MTWLTAKTCRIFKASCHWQEKNDAASIARASQYKLSCFASETNYVAKLTIRWANQTCGRHIRVFRELPMHCSAEGSEALQLRVRSLTPPPQVTEQSVQLDQRVQASQACKILGQPQRKFNILEYFIVDAGDC